MDGGYSDPMVHRKGDTAFSDTKGGRSAKTGACNSPAGGSRVRWGRTAWTAQTRLSFLFALILAFAAGGSGGASVAEAENGPLPGFTLENTLEIEAILASYGGMIQGVERTETDVVFTIRGQRIHYRDGKLLAEDQLPRSGEYTSLFYEYRTGQLEANPGYVPFPERRSSDFLDALFGRTDQEIRSSCRWVQLLGHRVYVQEVCAPALLEIDRSITNAARVSPEVDEFLRSIRVMYSMKRRQVSGTENMSYHSYGLAIDIIPRSYGGRHVYWRWSSVYLKDWDRIPFSQKWHPPQQVIDAFEKNGFVWGGKWYYFDNVHFEYRPEILYISGKNPHQNSPLRLHS
jgi:hypothetical protein